MRIVFFILIRTFVFVNILINYKTMKKTFIPFAAIALALAACNTTPKYTINGTVEGQQTGKAYLVKFADSKLDTLAQAPIADGKFTLTGSVAGLTDAIITIEGKRGGSPVFLENTVITFNLPEKGFAQITGTEAQKLYDQFAAIQMEMGKTQRELYGAYSEAAKAKDEAKMKEIEEQFNKAAEEGAAKEEALMKANADSYVAAYMLTQKMGGMELEDLQAQYDLLGANAKASDKGKEIAARIDKMAAVAIGKVAPDFTLNTPEGKPLSMHSIKAKVKVLDFWASWCGPCRGENPNVVAMYKELHPKGLEILSISLDNDKDAWLKAIKDDGLEWNHVSDLQGWNCAAAKLYGVNGIPHLIVLDENNVIVAKNLRGEALKEKVAELLAK